MPWRFILWRVVGMVAVLIAMTFLVFMLRQVVPSDPARAAVGPSAPQSVVDAKRKELGLDRPLLVQYGRYMKGLVHGDLGQSVTTLNPVSTDLRHYLPASLELIMYSLAIAAVLAMAFALMQTLVRGSEAFRQVLVSGASAPIFLTGLLMLYFLWFKLHWFPSGSRTSLQNAPAGPTGFLTIDGLIHGQPNVTVDALRHLFLPALALALPMSVAVGRTLRSSMIGVMRQDHIRTARSKGLTEFQITRRHVLRNSSTGAVGMVGLQIGFLFANLIIIERIFAWPGVGLYLAQALTRADLPATLGIALVFGIAYIVVNTLVDVAQSIADPRVSLE